VRRVARWRIGCLGYGIVVPYPRYRIEILYIYIYIIFFGWKLYYSFELGVEEILCMSLEI
jgi:hypothetical protein